MGEIKTKKTNASVAEFIAKVADDQKRKDSEKLLEIFSRATKEKAAMWGTSIIGFGQYHYKSERSKQEGDWLLTGFSPRKTSLTCYIMSGFSKYQDLLKKLGKHKVSGGSCLYINKLEEIDLKVLEEIIKDSYGEMKKK